MLLDGFNIKVTHPEGDSVTIGYGGFYIAEEPEYDAAQNLTSIIAYDELYPSMQAYTESLWQSGITVKNYLIAILDKLGINYDTNSLNLMANADKVITSEKYLDVENDSTEAAYTYRDILDEIAKSAGVTFAFRNSLSGDEYKLYAIKPTESGYVIDESNLRSVTIGAKYGPVKGVVLSREPQEDNVYYPSNLSSSSQTAVKIANVEIMEDSNNDEYRKQFAKGIYDNVAGTEYYLYELDSFGMAFLNFGDIFTIKAADRENGVIGAEKSYKTIFMRTDMTIGCGIKEKSKLEAPQATSTDYSAAESASEKLLKKTMLKVDKQEQRITALVKESDDKYSEFTQTINGLEGEIVDTKAGLEAQIAATSEAATSQYTALKAEVKDNYVSNTTFNTYVKQTAETLQMQAESIEQITAAGYISTDECKELISAEKGNITLAVERNLKIGARNILLDSACFESCIPSPRTATIQCGRLNDLKVPSGKVKRVVFNPTATATAGFKFAAANIIGDAVNNIKRLKPQTTYTLSWWMRYSDTGCTPGELSQNNLLFVGYGDQGSVVSYDTSRTVLPQISTSWQKFIATFTTPSEVLNCEMRLLFKNSTHDDNDVGYIIDISSLKLEEGNIATDWSPSSEDTEKSVQAKIDMCVKMDENGNLESEINISSDKLTIDTQNFTLAKDGTMTCENANLTNATISGTITAVNAILGGWHIADNELYSEYGSCTAHIKAPQSSSEYFFAVRESLGDNKYTSNFAINTDGSVYMNNLLAAEQGITVKTFKSKSNGYVENLTFHGLTRNNKYFDAITAVHDLTIDASNIHLYPDGGVYLHNYVYLSSYASGEAGKAALYVDTKTGEITVEN